jgi:hypothetical protein
MYPESCLARRLLGRRCLAVINGSGSLMLPLVKSARVGASEF